MNMKSEFDATAKIGAILCIIGLGMLMAIPFLAINLNYYWLGTVGWFLFAVPFIIGFGMLGFSWARGDNKA